MIEKVPDIIYGTAWKAGETSRLVQEAVRLGFSAIDTANQPKHYQEALVGEALLSLAKEGIGREKLFLQTKFTPADGQDQRIPYDPRAPFPAQVAQSFAGSLKNLNTDYLDSYLLHGPYSHPGLIDADWAVWRAIEELYHQGKTKRVGVSNVNDQQLALLIENAEVPPAIVQNRCYATRGWDKAVRDICKEAGIVYQGFSLLTANPGVLRDSRVQAIASRKNSTPEQIIYRFSSLLGITPLSGTTNPQHMREALESTALELSDVEVRTIEALS